MRTECQHPPENHSAALTACGSDVGVPVERRAGYPERLGDLGGTLAAGETDCCGGELVGVHDAGASVDAALDASRGEPGHRALMDDVSFEFGNAAMTALCIKAKGVPAMQQGGEAGTSGPWRTVTNRASGGLPHGFWASGWSRLGGPIA